MKKIQGSLYFSLMLMTWIPLIIFAMIITIFSSRALKNGMEQEVEEALRNLGFSIMNTFDKAYPGDYQVNDEGYFTKGGYVLYDDFSIIDQIKGETGVDVTLFYGNTRVLTTIQDMKDERIGGTYAADIVTKQVIYEGGDFFSTELSIYGKKYYGYYMPLKNSDNSVAGMLFVGKEQDQVLARVNRAVGQFVLIILAALVLAAACSFYFATSIVDSIKKMMEFLRKVSTGDLSAKQDEKLLVRNDEIGEMGRLTLAVQRSLRRLIERDALTNLYNRRSGENKLRELQREADESDKIFSIALGDIDLFKTFNDEYGHECGDIVLKNVSECFFGHFSTGKGYAIRWGGEEFLLVFKGLTEKEAYEEAKQVLKRIRECEISYGERVVSVTMTFGVAQYGKGETIEKLVKRADDRLYIGKSNGRNQVVME